MANPHDKWFKLVFGRPVVARALLARHLPWELRGMLDLERLESLRASFVGPDFRELHADLLFRIPWRRSGRAAVFVLEHKSWIDPKLEHGLRTYVERVRRRAARLERSPPGREPAVVAVAIYHGVRPWRRPATVAETLDAGHEEARVIAPLVDRLPLVPIDLRALPERELRFRCAPPLLVLGSLVAKYVRRRDFLRRVASWNEVGLVHATRDGREVIEALFRYTLEANPYVTGADEIARALAPVVGPEVEDMKLTAGEKLRNEGRIEGRIEGRMEALLLVLRARFSELRPEVIARIEAADPDQVERWLERAITEPTLDRVLDG